MAPEVVDIEMQREQVMISGRAVNFPANTGRSGVTLQIWEVDSATGARVTDEPHATFEIGDDGEWGPVAVDPTKHYEKVLIQGDSNQHFYAQPYLRSTKFVRLLSGDPETSDTVANTNTGPGHASLIALRMREWDSEDELSISTSSDAGNQDPVDAINSSVGSSAAIAIHVHDDAASPGETTTDDLPYFSGEAFQAGVDVYMPAADPPNGVITVVNVPRGAPGRPQTINLPNRASEHHSNMVMFSDFVQE